MNSLFEIQTPYEVTVDEDTPVGTAIFNGIKVEDVDFIGNPLDVVCGSSEVSTYKFFY